MLKKQKINNKRILFLILALAFLLRLYKITNPIADWHSFRQSDTASVTREYVKAEKIDILRPKYHDISNIQSGLENPEGYRMVEFPIVNASLALVLRQIPSLDLVLFSRLASVFASLGTIYFLYRLVKEISDEKLALLSAFIYAVLPYSVYYSRTILPEPFFLFFSTLSLQQFVLYLKNKKFRYYIHSILGLALAALLKPFVVFLAPLYLALLWQFGGIKSLKDWRIYLYVILSFTPFFLWRDWITNFPSGIPASDWLLNGNGIRLKPAWFRWLFYERIGKLFAGYFGLILLVVNLFKKSKDLFIYAAWWLSVVLYFIVIASGNVQHDYYQNLILPIISISFARGLIIIKDKSKKFGLALAGIVLTLTLFFSWQEVKGYFNVNNWEYIEAGKAVDRLVPEDAIVIAPAMGDTLFLFQTNRRGWPIGFWIEKKIEYGASVYVSTSYDDEARELEEKYQTIEKTEKYIILDLKKEK